MGGQDFTKLRDECIAKGALFEDPNFPAVGARISSPPPKEAVKWMRPTEISKESGKKPEFLIGGESRFSAQQGALGDCWWVLIQKLKLRR